MLYELRSEICHTIESYCDEPDFKEGLLHALSRPGFALHPEARCTAGILTLKVYEAICGIPTAAAFQAAVAVELYMEAAFIFDNVADQEMDAIHGTSVAEDLAMAIGLMACGGRAACEAGHQAGSEAQSLRSLLQIQKDCLRGSSGQFLDARLQRRGLISTDEALEMTCRKSGSLGRSAASLGAIMAAGDSETVDLFGELGSNLFTYLQLVDDLRDACPADYQRRDMIQYKKTLPLVYFYNYLSQGSTDSSSGIISAELNKQSSHEVYHGFKDSGADIFCAIVAETFLNRAKKNLAALKDRVRTLEGLEQFIGSFEINPDEILVAA